VKRALLLALVLCSACAHGNTLFRRKSDVTAEARADSLYWSAVANLDPANKSGTLDAALSNLDAYLASPCNLKHRNEAAVLRSLTRNSQQLARLEAALQQTRAAAAVDTAKARGENKPEPRARDEEMVKEIQRLKDELAKANEELERIKKRLAAPPSKP
jgi:hypothetical protein